MTTSWRDFCEAQGACPRCGGVNTVRVTQENDYGTTTQCDRCNNTVYSTKPYQGQRS